MTMHDTAKPQAATSPCPSCAGKGWCDQPDFSGVSMARIARRAGRSPALISRMLSDNPEQKRPNPTLDTMIEICHSIEEETGTPYSLDQLARAIKS